MVDTSPVREAETNEDDSISLTSTPKSFHDDDDCYAIEDIVAERSVGYGEMEYLVKWAGYSEDRNTWEPRENFQSNEVFHDWQIRKMRIIRGKERAFDVVAWEKRQDELEEAEKTRKERRERKRRRLSEELKELVSDSSNSNLSSQERRSKINSPSTNQSTSSSDEEPRMWTKDEEHVLTKILQEFDTRSWSEILSLYQTQQQSNRNLREMCIQDLKAKSTELRLEFSHAGREPPEWLRPRDILKLKMSINKPTISTPEYVMNGRVPKRRDSSASVESLLNELKQQDPKSTLLIKRANEKSTRRSMTPNFPHSPRLPENRSEKQRPSKESMHAARRSEGTTSAVEVATSPSHERVSAVKQPMPKPVDETTNTPNRSAEGPISISELSPSKHARPAHRRSSEFATSTELDANKFLQMSLDDAGSHQNVISRTHSDTRDLARAKNDHITVSARSNPNELIMSDTSQSRSNRPESPGNTISKSDPSRTRKPTTDESKQTKIIDANHPKIRPNEASALGTSRPDFGQHKSPKVKSPIENKAARLGVSGSGPAKSASSKSKDSNPHRKAILTGIRMTADRSARNVPRGLVGMLPAKKDVEKPRKHWNLSTQNRVQKLAQNEPAPDPEKLVFVDTKTGRTLHTKSTAPCTNTDVVTHQIKPLLQSHQEESTQTTSLHRAKDTLENLFVDQGTVENVTATNASPMPTEFSNTISKVDMPISTTSTAQSKKPAASCIAVSPAAADTQAEQTSAVSIHAPTGTRKVHYSNILSSHRDDKADGARPPEHLSVNSEMSAFTLMAKPTTDEKQLLYRTKDPHCVIGDISLGTELGPKDGPEQATFRVKFLGMDRSSSKELLKIKGPPWKMHFDFANTCLVNEYQYFFPASSSDYIGHGFVYPYPTSQNTYKTLAEILSTTLRGCIFFSPFFTMIMYPSGSTAWNYLDAQFPEIPAGSLLRFAIRRPLATDTKNGHPAMKKLASLDSERFLEFERIVQATSTTGTTQESNISVVFRDLFEIEYERLLPQIPPQNPERHKHEPAKVFFLCFIPQGCEIYEPDLGKRRALRARTSSEHDLFIDFLEANGTDEIYSMQDIGCSDAADNGAWDYFSKTVHFGTIIFHDACIRIDQLPGLAKYLRNGSIPVWKTSLSPMHEDEQHPHLVRLFPHGGAILLTESLILYRPSEALRIIMWFRLVHLPSKQSGIWKLAARPRLREWLLSLMDLYQDTQTNTFGHGMQIIADIYTEITLLIQKPNLPFTYLVYDCDPEVPLKEAPLVLPARLRELQDRKEWKQDAFGSMTPDHNNIRQNDDKLIQWFAEWAAVHLDSYRRFHAVLGYTPEDEFGKKAVKQYEDYWGHIEVIDPEDCFKRHNVTPQVKLDEIESKRRREQRENGLRIKAEAKRARAEERQTAKMALETVMGIYRERGASEEEVLRAGRNHLRRMGGSEKEVEECRVDSERVFTMEEMYARMLRMQGN